MTTTVPPFSLMTEEEEKKYRLLRAVNEARCMREGYGVSTARNQPIEVAAPFEYASGEAVSIYIDYAPEGQGLVRIHDKGRLSEFVFGIYKPILMSRWAELLALVDKEASAFGAEVYCRKGLVLLSSIEGLKRNFDRYISLALRLDGVVAAFFGLKEHGEGGVK